ncbi:hypothetical protein O9929_05100 [Vibrio lentus]|nr:hypothetical protein [Vibrio lentus]
MSASLSQQSIVAGGKAKISCRIVFTVSVAQRIDITDRKLKMGDCDLPALGHLVQASRESSLSFICTQNQQLGVLCLKLLRVEQGAVKNWLKDRVRFQRHSIQHQKEAGVLCSCPSVVATAMLADKTLNSPTFWILFVPKNSICSSSELNPSGL